MIKYPVPSTHSLSHPGLIFPLPTGCREPSPGHWGELSWTPIPSRPQDKAEAAEGVPRALDTDSPEVENAAVSAMLHAVAASRLPVCSQQQGEPDLTEQEKVAILGQLYHEKPLVFLERFRTGLREEHLACFGHLRGDHRADFYCAEVARQGTARPRTLRTRLRNRRYAALRELIQGVGLGRLGGRGDVGRGRKRQRCKSRSTGRRDGKVR